MQVRARNEYCSGSCKLVAEHSPVHDTYEGKADASFRGGHAAGQLDPVVMVSAMAAVTKSVSFGLTGSTTYIPVWISTLHLCLEL